MSGVIGSAGSKSGVIGTTELDYEEGTWSPNYQASGVTFTVNSGTTGTYTKIGKLVNCNFYLNINGSGGGVNPTGSSSAVNVIGLPFPVLNLSNSYISAFHGQIYNINLRGSENLMAYIGPNQSSIGLFFTEDNSTQTSMLSTDLDNHSNIGLMMGFTYRTN